MIARPQPQQLFLISLLVTKLLNAQYSPVFAAAKDCPLIPKCCEEDCCGPSTRWNVLTGYCQNDPSSPGFNGSHSDEWDNGCVQRVCCGVMCCSQGMEYDERNGFCRTAEQICTKDFSRVGLSIRGEEQGDSSGYSVSLSADGSIVAIGSPFGAGINGWRVGHVRVFRWTGAVWEQLGNTILGVAEENPEVSDEHEQGAVVSLSSDGTIVAYGMRLYGAFGGPNSGRGKTRVFQWRGKDWEQLGEDINGEQVFDTSGEAVSLSADGRMVAVGASGHDSGRGHVRVFHWNAERWEQLGNAIDGNAKGDYYGSSVSLASQNGKHVVAIGAPFARRAGNTEVGYTRVLQWNSTTKTWDQLGSDIDGEGALAYSGSSVALSSDGQIVVIGGISLNYNVRVFQFSGTEWKLVGSSIGDDDTHSGGVVALSGDGYVVAVGNPKNAQPSLGQVRVFQWDGESWVQLRNTMSGDRSLGRAVALSDDGSIVAGGAPAWSKSRGYARVLSCN